MNYLPFCGYWFYGADDDEERSIYFSSYGLLSEVGVTYYPIHTFTSETRDTTFSSDSEDTTFSSKSRDLSFS